MIPQLNQITTTQLPNLQASRLAQASTDGSTMNNPPLFKLSQEVIDEVVDFVDQESLAKCALAHRVFRHRSQSRLFSTIYLSSDRIQWGQQYYLCRYKRINAFLDILRVSPHIARYVRGLSLTISSFDNRWVAEEPIFLELMELLKRTGSHFETLHLIGMSFPEKFSDARMLEQHFLQPFISSSLTTLVISGILHIPLSLFANSPKLRRIKTFRSSVEDFSDDLDLSLLRCSPKIRHLHYLPPDATIESIIVYNVVSPQTKKDFNLSDLKPGLHASVFMNSITNFNLDLPPMADLAELRSITTISQDLEVLQNVIQMSRHSLEELHLFHKDVYSDETARYQHSSGLLVGRNSLAKHVNLSEVRCLRALSVDVMFPSPSTKCEPLEDICTVLETIPTENRLKVITLKFLIGFESCSHDVLSATKGDWRLLDSEITRIASQKSLRLRLQISYQMSDSDYGDLGDDDEAYDNLQEEMCGDVIRNLVEESLPKINTASSISLDFIYSVTG